MRTFFMRHCKRSIIKFLNNTQDIDVQPIFTIPYALFASKLYTNLSQTQMSLRMLYDTKSNELKVRALHYREILQ